VDDAAYLPLAAIAQDHQLTDMDGTVSREKVIRMNQLFCMLRK
jgi:hypothetical protein